MSMAHSLEVRPPLFDHRIVEFAARLPERLKIKWPRQKIILKSLMRDKLPGSILKRKKAGLIFRHMSSSAGHCFQFFRTR